MNTSVEQTIQDAAAQHIDQSNQSFAKLRLVANTQWKTVEVNGEKVKIPQEWDFGSVEDHIIMMEEQKKHQIPSSKILNYGDVPVVSQDMNLVNGYTNDKSKIIYVDKKPLLVFGDHTTKLKYINFDFVLGGDGTKVFYSNKGNTKFLYFSLLEKVRPIGYSRHFKFLKEVNIALPSHHEQTLIAQILTTQEEHIANLKQQSSVQRKRLDWLTSELLTGRILVHEDINGEPTVLERDEQGNVLKSLPAVTLSANTQWKTVEANGEDVEIPQGWDVKKIGDFASLVNGYAFKSSSYQKNGLFKVLTIKNVQDGYLNDNSFETIKEIPKDIRENQILNIGDVVMSMTGNVGRVCEIDSSNWLLNQRVLKLIPSEYVSNGFFIQILKAKKFCTTMQELANGGAQKNISSEHVRSYTFLYPSFTEQTLIAQILTTQEEHISSLDKAIELEEQRLAWLTDELLSGRILVEEVTK